MVAIDFLVINLLLWAFMRFLPDYVPPAFYSNTRMTFFIANVAMLIAEFFYSTILHIRLVTSLKIFRRVFNLTFLHVVLMFVFLRLMSTGGMFFTFIIIFFVSELVCLLVSRIFESYFIKHARSRGRNSRAVFFVGNDPSLLDVYKQLTSSPSYGYKALGYFADNDLENCPDGLERLGTIDKLLEIVRKTRDKSGALRGFTAEDSSILWTIKSADDLYCSLSHDSYQDVVDIIRFCDSNMIHFFYVPRLFGYYRLSLSPVTIGSITMFTNHTEPLSLPSNRFIKRTFDIIFSSIVCLCLLPFIPIIGLIIKIQSPGPIFFKQKRTGLNGETFECLKFRSMHVNAAADTQQATKDDPRKFPFGNFMRKTNIDEFPQFFNVLKGDMSIVGPRPHMLKHTEIYSKLIDKYMVRHFCRPGITGYAQIKGCRGETKELWQMEDRVRHDIWYIDHWSFGLDIYIILKTFISIFKPDDHAY